MIDFIEVFSEDFDSFDEELAPGKYYLSVQPAFFELSGETYEIRTGGAADAFGSPTATQARCKTATAAAVKAMAALEKAKRQLKRVRKKPSRPRKAKARHAVKLAKGRLGTALADEQLWCSIPA